MNAVTAAFLILSVPCKPRFIKAVVDCYTRTALVGWFPSDGALSYMVTATAMSGHNVTCEASFAHCELTGLLCGQSYSVSVKAVGETCSSIAHMSGQLVTGEQPQTNVTRLLGLVSSQCIYSSSDSSSAYRIRFLLSLGSDSNLFGEEK